MTDKIIDGDDFMKKMKKVLALLTGITLLTGVASGCMKKNSADDGNVKLTWMMLGPGEQKDSEKVWEAFNEKLQEYLPGTTIEFKVYSTSEYAEKYKLMSASNEAVDLVWVGWLVDYLGDARRGSFYPLNDLMDQYAPGIKEEVNSSLIDSVRVDGELYQIPNYQMMTSNRWGIATHKDLADKYWDAEKAKEVFYNAETMDESCYDVIEEYLEQLKANGELKLGVSTETFGRLAQKGYSELMMGVSSFRRNDPTYKIENIYEREDTKLYYKKMSEWYKKGYIRKDILTVDNPMQDEGKPNGYNLWVTQYFDNTADSLTKQNGFNIDIIPQNEEYFYDGGSATGTAISAKSKNPERAMQVLELMNTEKGKELYNMLVYGLEGEHYNKESDTRIETLSYQSAPDSSSTYGQYKWVVGNTFNAYEIQGDPVGWNDYIRGINENAVKSGLVGFTFDNTPVRTELAQIDAIKMEFTRTLNSGAVEDWEEYYNKFIDKLKGAGIDKVIAEMQKQVDDFLSKK